MYGLDVNFLNDRPEYKPVAVERRTRGGPAPGDRRPLFLGLGVGVAALALVGGGWLFLQTQNNQLREQQTQLEAQLGVLKQEQANLARINAETQQIKAESAALVGVFNAIKPWSATLGDISGRTPPNVRIISVTQKPPAKQAQRPSPRPSPSPAASPSPGASPSPSPAAASPSPSPGASPGVTEPPSTGVIEIIGQAGSFDNVNDFLLSLQSSKFLKRGKTRIVDAKLGEPRPVVSVQIGQQTGPAIPQNEIPKLPAEVTFTIETELTDVPASELIQELESQKATGLVTRIEQLQQKGVKP